MKSLARLAWGVAFLLALYVIVRLVADAFRPVVNSGSPRVDIVATADAQRAGPQATSTERARVAQATIAARPTAPPTWLTVDGYDSSGFLVDPVNLWHTYAPRDYVVAQLRHGERVKLIARDGDGVKVETTRGIHGWLTYHFIKEYK